MRCYRTVSTAAALILAGTVPGDLMSLEWDYIDRIKRADPSLSVSTLKREARITTIETWQTRWTALDTVAAWTKLVLPSIRRWVDRPAGAPVTFHLAQVLTRHGAFNEYLQRFGIIASAECAHCEAPVDDVEHTIFVCPF